MPSRNSINRPKLTVSLNRKNKHLAAKRLRRERAGEFSPARSSSQSKSGKIRSVPLELYFAQQGQDADGNGNVPVLTRKKLSKKKAQKIARDLRHIQRQQEREKKSLSGDASVPNTDDMNVDAGVSSSKSMQRKMDIANAKMSKNKLSLIKNALWKALETNNNNNTPNGLIVVGGQGTTLGGPFFP